MPLSDDDIVTTRISSRRRFLSRIGRITIGALGVVTASTIATSAEEKKKKDAVDFVPADNKAKQGRNNDKRSGDLVGK